LRLAKIAAWIGAIAMAAVIFNGFVNGNFGQDGGELLQNPWGIVSLVDLYVGFILFSLWIGFREAHPAAAAVWIVFMMVLGFFTASVYILAALHYSRGDWLTFFLGAKKDSLVKNA